MAETYTTGHCAHKNAPGGCQLHNLQCGYPECDRKAAAVPPMPVDPPEEARERLESLVKGLRDTRVHHLPLVSPKHYPALAADLSAILAELDRRYPPTREGEWVLVPREPTPEMRRAALDVWGELLSKRIPVFVAMPHVLKAALAAAPPPPDVSRGLDREEVARTAARELAVDFDALPSGLHLKDGFCQADFYGVADAIIALTTPPPTDKPE